MGRDRVAIAPAAISAADRHRIVAEALRRGFRRFVLRDPSDVPTEGIEVLLRSAPGALEWLRPEEGRPIPIVPVSGPDDLANAMAQGRARGGVAITLGADRVIPLENLLADAHGGRYPVWVVLDRLRDVPAMLGALERGAERLVVEVSTVGELTELESLLDEVAGTTIAWEAVAISRVASGGPGDRVLVDTTSLLRPDEGLLVGSAAAFLVHVLSEAVGSRFSRPRPFRVNAGAAHSYVLMADGSTRYLSELAAGDAVLAVAPHARPRAVRVGRIKIERRPLVLVEVARGPRRFTAFVQEAETVRLSGESGPISATQLVLGARVLGAGFSPARHLGTVIDETIEER